MKTLVATMPADKWSILEARCDKIGVSESICLYALLAEVWGSLFHRKPLRLRVARKRALSLRL